MHLLWWLSRSLYLYIYIDMFIFISICTYIDRWSYSFSFSCSFLHLFLSYTIVHIFSPRGPLRGLGRHHFPSLCSLLCRLGECRDICSTEPQTNEHTLLSLSVSLSLSLSLFLSISISISVSVSLPRYIYIYIYIWNVLYTSLSLYI